MRGFALALAALVALVALVASPARAQRVTLDRVTVADSSVVHRVKLRDGSVLVGRIVAVSGDSVRIRTSAAELTVARASVSDVAQYPATALRNGELWPDTPHSTRLIFSPTAIPLGKGEGYYSNFWLFVSSAAVGVTDRFTFGAGATTFPSRRFTNNVFYLLPKYTVLERPRSRVAVGALAASFPDWRNGSDRVSFGILYGVATFGGRESNLTFGSGWGYVRDEIADRPVLTIAGLHRFARRAAFISENWIVTEKHDAAALLSYGVRFLGEMLSVDLAFANAAGTGSGLFLPGIPLVGFAVKF